MAAQELIILDVFCEEFKIDTSIIWELKEFGLIQTIEQNEIHYLDRNHIVTVEKIIRLHTDLNINKEGIEVILDLLEKVNNLTLNLKNLKDRLSLYE